MANRSYHKPMGSLHVGVCTLWAKATIGATGAPTLVAAGSKGVASIVRSDVGKYTLTLSDSYHALLGATVTLLDDTDSDPTSVGCLHRLFSEAVSNATPTLVVQFFASDDGAAADPADGATVYVEIKLRNSSVV